jgi:tRNA threonylcarbamoyladenosine biosynthesis protein TsaE
MNPLTKVYCPMNKKVRNKSWNYKQMKRNIISESESETLNIAIELGRNARPGSIITLSGELGTGKTVMAKGIAKGLGIGDDITSPTFSLFEMYAGTLPLYHFDLYRIENSKELENLHFDEYWYGTGVSVVEWPERAEGILHGPLVSVMIERIDDEQRRITIEYPDY